MNLGQIARSALVTLRTQKLRTALTLFGMVWGTASVVFLLSWGLGVERMIDDGYSRSGRNIVYAYPGKIGEDFAPAHDRRALWFTRDHVAALRASLRDADVVLGESRGWYPVSAGEKMLTRDVRGVEPGAFEVRGVTIAAGRAISHADLQSRRRVAVLGDKARRRLLGPQGRVGDTVRIRGTPFEVIGFMAPVGTQLARDFDELDNQVWMPLTTLLGQGPRYGLDEDVIDMIVMRVHDRRRYDSLKADARAILARELGVSPQDEEAVLVISPLETLRKVPIDRMRGLFFILAVTTLAIGGIGILNMMLDSVQERRQEIGVRLAVGARRRDVVAQFFLETLFVTGVGGGLGLLLGIGGCVGLASLHVPDVIPLPILRAWIVWLAIGILGLVGIAAGIVPAWRAAGVDPSITLRAE